MVLTIVPFRAFAGNAAAPEDTSTVDDNKSGSVCLTEEDLKAQFEAAANPMFAGIAQKKDAYKGEFNEKTHTVTVTILNKDAKLTELGGTGLIAGLTQLYKENHLTKIKISDNDPIVLDKVWNYATTQLPEEDQNNEEKIKTSFMGNLKLLIGTHIGNTLKNNVALDLKKDTLGLFIGKKVNLELTIEQTGCKKPTSITYKVIGIAENGTTVDDSNVKPVDPNGDKQGTGIIVKNKDNDTNISATDEDGKDVPVEIDEDGKVIVTPGEDVDGPITVVIEDKDLPNGKVKVEVPVNGHEKGRDDNGSNSDNNKVDDNKGGKDKHETAIHKLYIYGYKDNTFRPEGNMTRAEAAAMIARLKGLDMSNNAKPNFSDVKSAWYNSSINAVVNAGYMKGYPDGTFAPNGKITRAEFAQMIMAIDKANGAAVPFADVKGHWAEAAIAQAYGNGRIAGYLDSTFRPNNNITRAEAVTVLNKLFDRSVENKGLADVRADFVPFVDVTANHWAYYQIIEASNTHEFYRTEQGKVGETWDKLL